MNGIAMVAGVILAGAAVASAAADDAEAVVRNPEVAHVCAVAPDVIAVEVHAKEVVHGKLQPYQKQPGDVIRDEAQTSWLVRNGAIVGAMAGPERKLLWSFDSVVGQDIDTQAAGKPGSYSISSEDDPDYRSPQKPTAVYRKSKPRDMARLGPWKFECSLSHVLYLRLPAAMKSRHLYQINLEPLGLQRVSYQHDPAQRRSEAVHVNQVGFHPQDGAKRAYLSCWMGDGGAVEYAESTRFQVLNLDSKKVAFSGQIKLGVPATQVEDNYKTNHNGTNVYWMDFPAVQAPGRYQVVVEGIGCSYPFEIRDDVYARSFYTSARGFYHQRSGIELRPPYTTFTRPRPFHPDDGVKVYASTCSLLDSGNGLNAKGTDNGNFGNLVKGATNEIVPDAWGGYFDAGDWDRRIQHLDGARFLLELAELFPDSFKDKELNIPESGNGLPDIVDEALWGLDVYRRMQTADGGIRGGIESSEHPSPGETSWLESKRIFAYAPDEWCSYTYAGDAARAAVVLKRYSKELSETYTKSAVRAFEFGEKKTQKGTQYAHHQVRDRRNHAALELWRLTGDDRYHQIFLETTLFVSPVADVWVWEKQDQRDAAFLYARLDLPGKDETIEANAREATIRETRMQPVESTGFNWTNLNKWIPMMGGPMSTPRVQLARAHYLTGDAKLLDALVLNCQSPMGANPVNISYTVGLGHDWPRNPLICDSRVGNLPPFPGVTVYGPADPKRMKDDFGQKLVSPAVYPAVETWPTAEAYFDVFMYPMECEFTVMQTIAPHSYVMGYLRAQRRVVGQ